MTDAAWAEPALILGSRSKSERNRHIFFWEPNLTPLLS
jgi:hypothetical protein